MSSKPFEIIGNVENKYVNVPIFKFNIQHSDVSDKFDVNVNFILQNDGVYYKTEEGFYKISVNYPEVKETMPGKKYKHIWAIKNYRELKSLYEEIITSMRRNSDKLLII